MTIASGDLRHALRLLLRNPAVSGIAVAALAVGIGANTAIFTVVDAVLLRPLPYREPERVVMVWEHMRTRQRPRNVISPANYLDWKDQNTVFEGMAAFHATRYNLTGVDNPEELTAHRVSANYFDLLGVRPLHGRTFLGGEDAVGRENVVVLGYGIWQRRFGADPKVVGRRIDLNGQSFEVVGVMPSTFRFDVPGSALALAPPEIWTAIPWTPQARTRRGRFMSAIARLRPDVTLQAAQAEMNAIAARLEREYPDFNTGWGVNLVELGEQSSGEIRQALVVLSGAVGFVLLIACANVANLLLARAAVRQREIAIRCAMGAGRWRIVRQLLSESLVLAVAGGAAGLVLAAWGVRLLLSALPPGLVPALEVGIDGRVLGFTLGVSIVTALVFGVVPALEASRQNLSESLKEGARGVSGGGRGERIRRFLVAGEIALALVLLVAAGLMIRSFVRLQAVDPGFRANSVLTFRLGLPGSKYGQDHQRTGFYRELLERIRAIPGVRSAGAISFLPFAGSGAATGFSIVGRPEPPAGQGLVCDVRVVFPGYFEAMGVPLVRGRSFNERDAAQVTAVVVVNETLVRQHFPNEDPIGKKLVIRMGARSASTEIVGIVGDTKHAGMDSAVRAMTYWPHPELAYGSMTIVARTDGDPRRLIPRMAAEVRSIDRDLPLADVRTMDQWVADSLGRARFSMLLFGAFAGVALVLAAVGIYGVMAYAVAQRTHEIGIRMALGASAGRVVALVVRQAMTFAALGIAAGLAAGLALARVVSTLLYDVSPRDPVTFAVIPVLLAAVAFVACCVPARRAARVDPVVALRQE